MKRCIALLAALMLLIGMVPLSASAAISPGKPTYGSASGYGTNFTLTGNPATDIVNVAKAQIGKNGTKLGYGFEWCCAFVSDCARIANIPTSVIPNGKVCSTMYSNLKNNCGAVPVSSPQAGDIVVYYCSKCNKYPHIGLYVGSNYLCEGNMGGAGTTLKTRKVNHYAKTNTYGSGCGHNTSNYIQRIYLRPNYAKTTVHTLAFNANGGSGSIASMKVADNGSFSLPKNTFTRTGYVFDGWHVKRSDGRWYCWDVGAWKTDSEIAANGHVKKPYTDGWTGTIDSSWKRGGITGAMTLTFYAQWKRKDYAISLYENHSGKNYMRNTDFRTLDTTLYSSRDTSVYTLSVDSGRTSQYGSLKIVGTKAGASGKDMAWRSSAMGNIRDNGCVGDNKTMTLSFWAKSSVAGAKMYIRFGYQTTDKLKSVALTTDWKYYTITLTKTTDCGAYFHPFFDKAGTFHISEMQLEDGASATAFVPEKGGVTEVAATSGQTYTTLTTPKRTGYTFAGWYTAANGGAKVDANTAVKYGHMTLYAHWKKTNTFPDVREGDWYYDAVEYVAKNGFMSGYKNGNFGPANNLQRQDFVVMLARIGRADLTEYAGQTGGMTDVGKNAYFANAVAWAVDQGIITGYNNGKFGVGNKITREQVCTILYRYVGEPTVSGVNATLSAFPDKSTVSPYARNAMAWAVQNGVISGTSKGTIAPSSGASRAQIATIIMRMDQNGLL